jgi:hypothetical protein
MDPNKKIKDSIKGVKNELEVEEEFEMKYDYKNKGGGPAPRQQVINGKKTPHESPINGQNAGLKKSTVAGILLIIAFILNLFFPIMFITTLQEIQNSTGETILKGKIEDLDNKPVANVSVIIVETGLETLTNETGEYKFDNVPVGVQEIHYTKLGYQKLVIKKTLFSTDILDQGGLKENIIDIPGNLSSGIQIGSFEGLYNETIDLNKTKFSIEDRLYSEFSIIKGNLLDDEENEIKNINISLYRIEPGINETEKLFLTQVVDESGEFSFDNVPIGSYVIKVNEFGYSLLEVNNITISKSIELELIDLQLYKLDETVLIEEDIFNEYTYICIIILFLLAFLTLIGGISALQGKRYSFAFIGAMAGLLPVLLAFQANLCMASIVSLLAFILIVFSRKEFQFGKAKGKSKK